MKSTVFIHKVTLSFGEGWGEEKNFAIQKSSYQRVKDKVKKTSKKALKKLVKVNKRCTFAPATTQTFIHKLASK